MGKIGGKVPTKSADVMDVFTGLGVESCRAQTVRQIGVKTGGDFLYGQSSIVTFTRYVNRATIIEH